MRPPAPGAPGAAPAPGPAAQRRVGHHRREHPGGQRHLERLDDPPAGAGRGDLAQVRRHDDRRAADAEADHEPPDDERAEPPRERHDQRAQDEGRGDPAQGRDAAVGLHARAPRGGARDGAGLGGAYGGADRRVREAEVPGEGQGGTADEALVVAGFVCAAGAGRRGVGVAWGGVRVRQGAGGEQRTRSLEVEVESSSVIVS